MLTTEERMQIRAELPHGSCYKIADMAKVPTPYVSQWFSGRINSKKIEDCVIMLIVDERREREEKMKSAGIL